MAKIERKAQQIFADAAIVSDNIAQFGSLKAGTPQFSKDPDVIQALEAFTLGWKSATVLNNAPALQDDNALMYLFSRQLAYLFQAGIPEYSATTTYYANSYCQAVGVVYRSLVDDNTGNAVSDVTKWAPLLADGLPGTVSSSTSGAIGSSNQAAREDHSHHLGAHTHADATSGGTLVAASATQTGAVSTGAQTFAGRKTFQNGAVTEVIQSGIGAGDSTLDCSVYDTFLKTGSASGTTITLSGMYAGQTVTVAITTVASQAAINFAGVKWSGGQAPTPTTTASRIDRYVFQILGGVIYGSADMNCY